MAIEHSAILDPEQHEPKGISSAFDKQVYRADGLGSGNWEDLPTEPSKVVLVENVSDFPTAVAGVISLDGDTIYRIRGTVDLGADRLVLDNTNGTLIEGFSGLQDRLVYSGTNAMITALQADISMRDLGIQCPNGPVFQFENVNPDVNLATFDTVIFEQCAKVGTFQDGNVTYFTGCIFTQITETPAFQFVGSHDLFQLETSIITSYTGTLFDLDSATFDIFKMVDTRLTHSTGNVVLSGLTDSANINVGGRGTLVDNDSFGETPTISGVDSADSRWRFAGNNNIPDSVVRGFLYYSGNVTDTIISTSSTYTDLAGTYTLSTNSERVFEVSEGVMEIEAETPVNTRVQCNVSMVHTGPSGQRDVKVAIFESTSSDGITWSTFSQVLGIESEATIDNNVFSNIVVSAPITTAQYSRYKVQVSNESDTANLRATSIQFYLG